MKHPLSISTVYLLLFLLLQAGRGAAAPADMYIVFFVTQNGITGHVGIAIDNYDIRIRDTWKNGKPITLEDTVTNGTLTFFDLWPQKDVKVGDFHKNTVPLYFRLPRSSAEPKITVESILYQGLPHRYRVPCDGLLRIRSSSAEDFKLAAFIDSLPQIRTEYNARHFNCADFVIVCLQQHFGFLIKAKEFIPMGWVSTPNRLYRRSCQRLPVEVLRDPGPKVKRSFFKERVLKKYFSNKHSDNEND
jgi:hypothetical protein